ncbi:MAG: TetR/AcrR family transcriptional regulator, partial [Oscillospiraceae bacterium]|nr:TetR/AcrR family transcriptional regulator [Oscillospiraceae bacterium]
MSKQRNLTEQAVMTAAVTLVEQNGYNSLNISSLAEELDIKPPSLYNYISGIDDVMRKLAVIVLLRMEEAVKTAAVGRSEESAVRAIAVGYRAFASNHPELYRAFTSAPSIDAEGNLGSLAGTLRQVLAPFGLTDTDEVNFIRLFHSALHGFVALESAGFF